jgi:hypothetical protein
MEKTDVYVKDDMMIKTKIGSTWRILVLKCENSAREDRSNCQRLRM